MARRLFSWIGDTDIKSQQNGVEPGPLARTIADHRFDQVHALFNYPEERVDPYRTWLVARSSSPIEFTHLPLRSPVDHESIYRAVTSVLDAKVSKGKDKLTFLLSPGTPAMHSVWLLLAKTLFPARLLQSSREVGVEEAHVPFDIAVDFLPGFLREPDAALAELSEGRVRDAAFSSLTWRSRAMGDLVDLAHRLAQRDIPVLLLGESGTGKEVLARAIHQASARGKRRMINVNCGAIPEGLVESELFGHKKGSFSGALKDRKGHFQEADKSTIFLDEIGELAPSTQVRLLRVLQERTVIPLGSSEDVPVDVRVIAATHRRLPEEVRAGRFREDLFYRLAVGVLEIPPLRSRREDLGPLIDALLEEINAEHARRPEGYTAKVLTAGARSKLLAHSWPGNVRELRNTLVRATAFARGDRVEAEDIVLFPALAERHDDVLGRPLGEGFDIDALLAEVERAYVDRALQEGGSKAEAARLLGLKSYQALDYRLKRMREG